MEKFRQIFEGSENSDLNKIVKDLEKLGYKITKDKYSGWTGIIPFKTNSDYDEFLLELGEKSDGSFYAEVADGDGVFYKITGSDKKDAKSIDKWIRKNITD